MDRTYVMTALGYALLGMLLGVYMAKSHDFNQSVTHAHLLLLGFVVSFIYAVCFKLWLPRPPKLLARAQFISHQAGTAVLVVALFLVYGGHVSEPTLSPVLGLASLALIAAVVLMKIMVAKSPKT